MFVVTNRSVSQRKKGLDAFGADPNPKGPNELRIAEAKRDGDGWAIEVLPDKIPGPMARAAGIVRRRDPETGRREPIWASRYVAKKLLERIRPSAEAPRGRNLVVFVHGFNNDMKAVLERAETLQRNYDVEVLAFSWPANGGGAKGVISYKSDKRDALASVGALDRTFGKIDELLRREHAEHVARVEAEANERFSDDAAAWDRFFSTAAHDYCPFSVTLLAHSMGNYLLKHLTKSSVYRGGLSLFDNVLLVAADTNSDGHAEWVDRLSARRRVFITINEDDSALRASRLKMGEAQRARLGHYPYGLDSRRAVYVDFTDEREVGSSHAYFEGDPIQNDAVRGFFHAAVNGRAAESALEYDSGRNMYRFR